MKKFIVIMMVIAMVAAFVPTSFAKQEVKTNNAAVDKSQFNTLDHPQLYGVDNYGNKVATGSNSVAKEIDLSTVTNKVQAKSETKAAGFADAPHYGVGFFDPSQSLEYGYEFDNTDFPGATDFDTGKAKTYNMFFSPAEESPDESGPLSSTTIKRFKKGERFWFNFDLISGYSTSAGPIHYLDKDGNNAAIPYAIYMYSGSASEWNSETGVASLKLTACYDGLTRISKEIVAPKDNIVYVFAVVVYDSVVTDYNIRGFHGWLSISEYEKTFKELRVDSKIEPYKQYEADLGNAESTLVYGDDIGLVLANAKMYEVNLKGGEKYAITAEGDGKIGGRVFFLDENKDLITGNYVGTGAVSSQDDYKTLSWPVFPPIDGTYYIVIAGFCYTDEGKMNFELADYAEVQHDLAGMEILPYLPKVDLDIDLETLGTEDVIEEVEGEGVWGYFYSADVQLGILVLAYPGTYHITGDNPNVIADIYDGVVMDLKNATIGSVIVNPQYAPATINSTGKSKIIDNFYGIAVYNYDNCYSAVYFTGDELEVAGEKNNGVLLQNPVHVLTKKFVAGTKDIQNVFTAAIWTKDGIFNPKLTLGKNAKITDDRNAALKQCMMFYDKDGFYACGYTISQYASVFRYYGSPDFYQIAGDIVITSEGGNNPNPNPDPGPGPDPDKTMLGDANLDGSVNTGDATMVLKHAASMLSLEGQALINADVNQDKSVNTGDATMILKIAANLIPNPNN